MNTMKKQTKTKFFYFNLTISVCIDLHTPHPPVTSSFVDGRPPDLVYEDDLMFRVPSGDILRETFEMLRGHPGDILQVTFGGV